MEHLSPDPCMYIVLLWERSRMENKRVYLCSKNARIKILLGKATDIERLSTRCSQGSQKWPTPPREVIYSFQSNIYITINLGVIRDSACHKQRVIQCGSSSLNPGEKQLVISTVNFSNVAYCVVKDLVCESHMPLSYTLHAYVIADARAF